MSTIRELLRERLEKMTPEQRAEWFADKREDDES